MKEVPPLPRLLHGVIRRQRKQRSRGFLPLDICQSVGSFAKARVIARALHNDLQIGRIPLLAGNDDWLLVANLPGRNGVRITSSLRTDSFDRLCAQAFFFHCAVGNLLLSASFELLPKLTILPAHRRERKLLRYFLVWVQDKSCRGHWIMNHDEGVSLARTGKGSQAR